MNDWALGFICFCAGLTVGGTFGVIVAGMMACAYKDDEKHGRQEWQVDSQTAEELFGNKSG